MGAVQQGQLADSDLTADRYPVAGLVTGDRLLGVTGPGRAEFGESG